MLIAAERGTLDLAHLTGVRSEEEIAIAAITASELLHGVHRLRGAVARTRAERFVEHLLDAIPVILFDLEVARVHARLDTAVSLDYRVATRDLRSFPRIKGLHIVRW